MHSLYANINSVLTKCSNVSKAFKCTFTLFETITHFGNTLVAFSNKEHRDFKSILNQQLRFLLLSTTNSWICHWWG